MKLLLVCILASIALFNGAAFGEKATYFDKVKFIQYSDDNTALEEVKNGHLDIYYSPIPVDRLDDNTRKDLQIFQSTGTSYSLLINPAPSEDFNPFSIQQVRFALNYLVDRDLMVDELFDGYGAPMISAYKPYDPDFLLILDKLQSLNFKHNPELANQMISDALEKAGANKIGTNWFYKSKPITISIFIRNDDPIRKSFGEILASQLQQMGFVVKKDYGDLPKAFAVVYGSNPSDLKWSIYTEAFTSSGFVRYDSVLTAQMYSPWYSNMPGFNNPSYWNFQDNEIDDLSKQIFFGNFTSHDARSDLIKKAVTLGMRDSVRIFLACKNDQFIANPKVSGIINDFGAGITSRFTPINARSDSDTLVIGTKKIYSGSWNPIAGFTDSASEQIWGILSDPGSFKNPYTGYTIPIRSDWKVEANGPYGRVNVPSDAIFWNVAQQKWSQVGSGIKATSKVTFHLHFGNWHNKIPMDMNDVLYGIYFMYQWGTNSNGTLTFDSEYSPKASQAAKTLVGVRIVDDKTIEVYQNYWHFDNDEIAESAQVWPAMPWEIIYSMEKSVMDGKLAFSRSDAISKDIGWLSLIIPNDADVLKNNLIEFEDKKSIPKSLMFKDNEFGYYSARYNASITWIEKHHHAVISDGPYFLDTYSPESRQITVNTFDNSMYPISKGHWNSLENITLPKINYVRMPTFVEVGKQVEIPISVTPNSTVYYFLSSPDGNIVDRKNFISKTGNQNIIFDTNNHTNIQLGAYDLQIFVVSDDAFKPDTFHSSFLVTNSNVNATNYSATQNTVIGSPNIYALILILLTVIVSLTFYVIRRRVRNGI